MLFRIQIWIRIGFTGQDCVHIKVMWLWFTLLSCYSKEIEVQQKLNNKVKNESKVQLNSEK